MNVDVDVDVDGFPRTLPSTSSPPSDACYDDSVNEAGAIGPTLDAPPDPDRVDHCVTFRRVSWEQYEALLGTRGESDLPRMTFLRGTLHVMSPSAAHDSISRMFVRVLGVVAEEMGIDLNAFGSWTLKAEPERGLEPDESFVLGERSKPVPDLAIEVLWTSKIADKLEVYRGLRVPEVWCWEAGAIAVFVLRDDRYERVLRSALLPALDLELVARIVVRKDQRKAIQELRESLRRAS